MKVPSLHILALDDIGKPYATMSLLAINFFMHLFSLAEHCS